MDEPKYTVHKDEGYTTGCSRCGYEHDELQTVETERQARAGKVTKEGTEHLCPYCYETQVGQVLFYERGDTETATMLAQCFNTLELRLRAALKEGRNG